MKKKMILSVALLLALTGCSKNNNKKNSSSEEVSSVVVSSEENKYDRDVDYPTLIPLLNEDSIQIHYQRSDNQYAKWALWLWAKGHDGTHYPFNYQDDYGVVASYPLSLFSDTTVEDSLGFIVKEGDNTTWTSKDVDSDRFIDFSTLEKDANGVYHVYLVGGDENMYLNEDKKLAHKITTCKVMYEKSLDKFDIFFQANTKMKHYVVKEGDSIIAEGDMSSSSKHVYLEAGRKVDIKKNYSVSVTFEDEAKLTQNVSMNNVYDLESFQSEYNYSGTLGAIYTKEETTFKVWSPVATKIVLKVYNNGTPVSISKELGSDECTDTEMTLGENGVFSTTLAGDMEGKYYTYMVYSKDYPEGKEIVDPYANSCGINGLRGMVVDFSKTNPDSWDEVNINAYDRKSLVVYETHVVDVTSSSTWGGSSSNAKKYLGLIEEGTTLPGDSSIKTGFDHIKELGINAIQLQPIFDYQSDEVNPVFNWGYDPLNYNSLEGSYSSNPYDGYERIKEFKKVVKAYTSNGINVIMDVVYNHVNNAPGSNFDVLCPGYYYRYNGLGELTNGSGCGNETASEHYMMQKFIVDSVSFWASEYKLGGFRFDLMGLHDVDTMNKVASTLKEINPYITVYGEPWTGGTSGMPSGTIAATQANGGKYEGYGAFNDQMRDALIKGGLSGVAEKGWITDDESVTVSDVTKITYGMEGKTNANITDPDKTVNYATCHDNYTLYDRIKAAGITDEDTILSMAQLANAVVFTSEGTSFMLAGEEMLRTKNGDSNSYKSSYAVNALDYSKLKDEKIAKLYNNYRDLIDFKTKTAAMHLSESEIAEDVKIDTDEENAVIKSVITYNGHEYTIIHANGTLKKDTYALDIGDSEVLVNTTGSITYLEPYQTIILKK